ncbi:hypothetical protein DQ04_01131040 [Trypanosoma grayi]|uniref:hypothetical protein n=1 Tax=Trypanosoma grayi TaxID=71804 RepID=UPI0004F4A274|nr:hypothetical protein DQ04_01131040 [Trypanosoma grayi]KEG13235.1 hypothetical protein DQ04_01131040 [Trypanosoma grayi]
MRFLMLLWLLVGLLFTSDTNICSGTDAALNYDVVQRASRDGTTRSITFLSSGYSSEEASRFDSDVRTCVAALHNKVKSVSSDPWGRYAALLNMYSVFRPSNHSGASRPHGTNHLCKNMKDCGPSFVENNLGCAFGTPDPSVISCNLSAVFALAAAAPVRDLVVVLVNEPTEVSSAGGRSLAIFTNKPSFMPLFLVRELSKAVASLVSEYSRGVEEKGDVRVPNCVATVEQARLEWGHWMDQGLVDTTPKLGCFFNNYYRPTDFGCMMRDSSVSSMCAVCKEQVTLALFTKGAGLSLAATRCPWEEHTVHVNISKGVELTVGEIGAQAGVVVKWVDESGTAIAASEGSAGTLLVPGSTLSTWKFPTTVSAMIEDVSPYVARSKRQESFRRTTTFQLIVQGGDLCKNMECASFSACTSCSGPSCAVNVTPHEENIEWVTYQEEGQRSGNNVIAGSVCGGVTFVVLTLILVLYYYCYFNRPHEVLTTLFMDDLLCAVLQMVSIVVLAFSIYILVLTVEYAETHVLLWRQLFIPCVIVGAIIFIAAPVNLVAVLFRYYALAVGCAVLLITLGLGFMGIGVFLAWTYMRRDTDGLIAYVAYRWMISVRDSPDVVDKTQHSLKCSGFYVSCLEANASYCPNNRKSNMYVNPCEDPFMDDVANASVPICVSTLMAGILLISSAVLNIVFAIRFSHLSRIRRRRHAYRNDPAAPILPFTFAEAKEARRIFHVIADKTDNALVGKRASRFLRKMFREKLDPEYQTLVETHVPMTYDELMSLHFPFFVTLRMDPRQLTPDEAYKAQGVLDLQRLQYQKLEEFAEASGALSPEALYRLFYGFASGRFIADQNEFLTVVRQEAAENCPDAPLCDGLTVFELEGLRSVWVALNPKVVGDLSDEQIDILYQWTHGEPLRNVGHFNEWKKSLDVRQRGGIGWGEFCYPFAKRAHLLQSRDYLSHLNKDVPPEMLSRAFVVQQFGNDLEAAVFLPYENEIPIERVLAHLMQRYGYKPE